MLATRNKAESCHSKMVAWVLFVSAAASKRFEGRTQLQIPTLLDSREEHIETLQL